jgi:hypothetical protein
MADIFSVTAPLAIRLADGVRQIMIERHSVSRRYPVPAAVVD